jgi:hypothetical protein
MNFSLQREAFITKTNLLHQEKSSTPRFVFNPQMRLHPLGKDFTFMR